VSIELAACLGLLTPPYGVLLFVISGLTGTPIATIIRELWPFLGVLIASLLVMVLVPGIVTFLPGLFA